MTLLFGKNVLITGASRSLGAGLARTFCEAGANLLLVGRSADGLDGVRAGLVTAGGQRVFTQAEDLSDCGAPERIVATAIARFGSLDVLVNNAAAQGPIGPLWENDWAEWQRTLRVDLLAPVALCRLVVPIMRRGADRSKIINLSGGGATGPRPNFSAYATAKAGLVRFTETLAREVEAMGIDVNAVAPGAIDSGMTEAILAAGTTAAGEREYQTAARVREASRSFLHEPNGDPIERAASLCVFLASSRSDGITGRLISAVWDPWAELPERLSDIKASDIYTLRRIIPKDRGMAWGEK